MRRLVIYCNEYGQTWWPKWGPSSLHKSKESGGGLGGSEEAVVFLSRELAALDWPDGNKKWRVEVYADPPDDDVGVDAFGVWWLPFASLEPFERELFEGGSPATSESNELGDVFVAWRYHVSTALALPPYPFTDAGAPHQNSGTSVAAGYRPRKSRVFVWLQDMPVASAYTTGFTAAVDGFFCLSKFHVRQLPKHAQASRKGVKDTA